MRVVIAGGGISGLSLAYWLRESGAEGLEATVLEAEGRPGGKIWTDRADGFLCESGVNGFLDNKPRTLELAARLSLQPIRGSEAAKKRFVFSGGKLRRLPESPPAFLASGLISPLGKLRIMCEALVPRDGSPGESLADFARRRLGTEALEKLIDPMASGIYAGDPEEMNLMSCFPKVYELENRYGSLIRGMFKLMRERRKKVGAGPGGRLASFREGMQALTDALRGSLGDAVMLGKRVASVEPARGGGYRVHVSDGTSLEADVVVLAAPAYEAANILMGLDASMSRVLRRIQYPSLSVVCTGYRAEKIKAPLDGFGFLVPYREKRKILGTLFDSSIYPGRAPEGHVLLRTMIGGARASSLAMLEDGKLLDTVLAEVGSITGIRAEPDLVRIYRHERAIPQYGLEHPGRVEELSALAGRHRGLYVTGNAIRGIGVNDCIENSHELAGRILKEAG